MEFEKMVEEVLKEDNVAGGASSALGPNVASTTTQFSGDNYAPGDARKPTSLYGGVITRRGMSKTDKKTKRKKKSK